MAFHISHNQLAITIVGILGNIISGMVYLAPLPTYYRIYKKKSTQGFQSVPYVVALFSAMLWLYYALLNNNQYFLITINSVGCLTQTFYIAFFYAYAPPNARIGIAKLVFALNLGVFTLIVVTIQLLIDDASNRVYVLGYICAVVSATVFAAPLTIMVKVMRTKSVEFMPFPLSLSLTLCAVVWFAYGLLRRDSFISIPNIFGFVLGVFQMVIYWICKKCWSSKELSDMNDNVNLEKNITTVDQQLQVHIEQQDQNRKDIQEESINGSGQHHIPASLDRVH